MNVKKIIYILLGLLIAVGIVIGRHQLQAKREYDQMVEIVESKEVKHLIEDDLKYFDKNALSNKGRVKEYSIDKKSIKKIPWVVSWLIFILITTKNISYPIH